MTASQTFKALLVAFAVFLIGTAPWGRPHAGPPHGPSAQAGLNGLVNGFIPA